MADATQSLPTTAPVKRGTARRLGLDRPQVLPPARARWRSPTELVVTARATLSGTVPVIDQTPPVTWQLDGGLTRSCTRCGFWQWSASDAFTPATHLCADGELLVRRQTCW